MAFMFICLLIPILILVALLGLGRYEDRLLRVQAPNARGEPPPGSVPAPGWPEIPALDSLPALDSGPGAAAVRPGIER
jgi:hypothetical protein